MKLMCWLLFVVVLTMPLAAGGDNILQKFFMMMGRGDRKRRKGDATVADVRDRESCADPKSLQDLKQKLLAADDAKAKATRQQEEAVKKLDNLHGELDHL